MVQKWLPRPRLLIVSSRGLFFSLSCLPASECPPRDFCKSLLFSTAELSQGQQRFHECLRVAAGYIERWHSASWPALLVQLGTEVACRDLAPSLPSMKTNTLGTHPRSTQRAHMLCQFLDLFQQLPSVQCASMNDASCCGAMKDTCARNCRCELLLKS